MTESGQARLTAVMPNEGNDILAESRRKFKGWQNQKAVSFRPSTISWVNC